MRNITILLFALACILLNHAPSQAADTNAIKAIIVKNAISLGVDPAIALSIARTESGFRHEARSSHGAVGVYQLMPSTARKMGLNPYSLNDNIKGGIMYYKKMYSMFGSVELALAAYNAGPGNVKRYNNAIPPYAETRRFVSKIMTDVNKQRVTPDPIVAKVKSGAYSAKAPVGESTKKQEIVEELPIKLELETSSVAI